MNNQLAKTFSSPQLTRLETAAACGARRDSRSRSC
jgi:hypothetical protein